ncbi:tRNA (guanine-N7)-methyltransferase [Helicobacter mehlei]|uniref:tRNA (guanine-N(7)-)-methyltransferase n=1 Tax=Helicobacter mehlei TaxID=2316080 RepID=A0A553UZD6_9HELI|nr:tRNA (guanine-N7)-methyltransferase [Helicobacter mehlei]TSA85586.1 tRNA (guanine-N7)-methyltransferase [Helicobacter mehlei]
MPHLFASLAKLPDFPFESEGFVFLYRACSLRDAHLSAIRVQKQGLYGLYDFCILQIKQKGGDLFKAQKSTRPLPVGVLQKALQILARFCKVSYSNLGTPSPYFESPFLIHWDRFAFPQSYHLEIGFGSGRHLLNKAQKNPQETYIGVEIHTPSLEQVLRQIELLGLKNLYLAQADARALLEILPSGCLGLDVHFPVPWSKSPNRRVMNPQTLEHMRAILCKNAWLWLRSDDKPYFQQSLQLVLSLPCCDLQVCKNIDQDMVLSKYEARWRRQQKDIWDLKLRVLNPINRSYLPFSLDAPLHFKAPTKQEPLHLWQQKAWIQENCFLNIQDVLEYENLWLLVLSLGDLLTPLNKMVVVDRKKGTIEYIGGLPLNTKAHRQAHQHLLEILQEENCG